MEEPRIEIGVDAKTGKAVSVALSAFALHTWLMGQSGAMKSVFATLLATLLMTADPKAAFVIGDNGGDLATFWLVKQCAERLGKPFYFLSLNPDDDYSTLNVMDAITPLTNIPRATSYFTSSLSLDAVGYARTYFSLHNWNDFAGAMEELVAEGNVSPTFWQLVKKLHERGKKRRLSDMTEAQLAAEALLHYPQLEPSEFPNREIHISEAIEAGAVIYGFLPTLMEPAARSITAMLHWSVVLEQMRRHELGLPRRVVYDFMDEFASVSGAKAISDLVTLARKYHVRLCLINQNADQLVGNDRDLRRTIFTNTAIKIFLTPYAGDDLLFMQDLSPEVIKKRGLSQTHRGLQSSSSTTQQLAPDLEKNEALEVSFSRFEALVSINDMGGYKPPIRMRFEPPCSKEEHEKLSATPLPKRAGAWPPAPYGDAARSLDADAVRARAQALDALLAACRAEETWMDPARA